MGTHNTLESSHENITVMNSELPLDKLISPLAHIVTSANLEKSHRNPLEVAHLIEGATSNISSSIAHKTEQHPRKEYLLVNPIVAEDSHGPMNEFQQIKEENEKLKSFIPEDILENLPSDLQSMLINEVTTAREPIIQTDLQEKSEITEEKIEEKAKDETELSTQIVSRDNIEDNTNSHKSKSDIEELLMLVNGLDEETSKFVYNELQVVLKEIDSDIKDQKIKSMKEELIKLQIEQTNLMPSIPEDIINNLPLEISENLQSALKGAYLQMATTEEVDHKKMEVEKIIDEFFEP